MLRDNAVVAAFTAPQSAPPVDGRAYLMRLLAVAAGLTAVCYGYQLLLGSSDVEHPNRFVPVFPWRYFLYGATFLTATTWFRERREWAMAVVTLACLNHLFLTCWQLVPYLAVLVPTLYRLLGREDRPGREASRRFWIGVGLGVVWIPKCIEAFGLHYSHGNWLDDNQNVFMGLFCATPTTITNGGAGSSQGGDFGNTWPICCSCRRLPGCSTCRPRRWRSGGGLARGA